MASLAGRISQGFTGKALCMLLGSQASLSSLSLLRALLFLDVPSTAVFHGFMVGFHRSEKSGRPAISQELLSTLLPEGPAQLHDDQASGVP